MELPVVEFIRARIQEADPDFDTRPGTAFHEMFIKPQELMLQPLSNTLDQILVSQSIRRILAQPDPDSYTESDVDDLVANLFVTRDEGSFATTTVRIYYADPLDKEYPAFSAEFTAGSLSYFNSEDILITAQEMALQTEGTFYYVDVAARAQSEGDDYNLDAGALTGFVNDTDSIRVTNLSAAVGGLPRETNTQLLSRAQNSIGVRDLETTKGINAILREKFPFIRQISSIGMGDPEMQRDIEYNVHVGGRTDVYLKTPSLTTASQDFAGLDFDLTRNIDRQAHIEMAKAVDDAIIPSDLGTPQLVTGSVRVREDVVETSAALLSLQIPPSTGLNLVGKEFINIQIDSLPATRIKISGATPFATQRFEIINSINAAVGFTVAKPASGNRIQITSQIVGGQSQITLLDTGAFAQGGTALFGTSSFPQTVTGVAAEVYQETVDYAVDYDGGLIYQKPFQGRELPTILSGQTMINGATDGRVVLDGNAYYFESSVADKFLDAYAPCKVRVGDTVTVTAIAGETEGTVIGDLPQSFNVLDVISTQRLSLQGFTPTQAFDQVQYSVVSNQVVVIDYQYNPISIDVGAQTLLADGLNRGIRPGRTDMTLANTPLIDIVSVQEIDPESGETIADPLLPPRGYGFGGFGSGGYGIGAGGEYEFKILAPRDRFSVFDNAVILFGEDALSRSYRVTYRWVPEIVDIHNLSRDDSERVTGADVLPKNFVPAFVDMNLSVRRDPKNLTTPTNDVLSKLVQDFVNQKSGLDGVIASDVSQLLENQGVESVQIPFDMSATVVNPDGTTTILQNQDILQFPDVVLDRDTENYTTKRILHFYPGQITVNDI
jgi:hypothetical protein